MTRPWLTPTRWGLVAAALVAVVLTAVLVRRDDVTERDVGVASAPSTTTVRPDGRDPTGSNSSDENPDGSASGTTAPTTAPPPTTSDDAPADRDGPGEGADPVPPPGSGGDRGGTDESTGVGGDDPQSPPAAAPGGQQGPVRRSPCAATGPPTITDRLQDGPSGDGGRWVGVGRLSGNCGGTSPSSFRTAAVDTRIVFRSDADQIIVFLVDVDDPDSSAGYADVECRQRCAGSQGLQSRAATYRIRVDATDGPWTVEVQEYRR